MDSISPLLNNDKASINDTSRQLPPLWDLELIRKYDLSGPRYTSYPTAPQFTTEFGDGDWQAAMALSNQRNSPLSLYFHIPFCETVCYYCGCNKVITANKKRALPYLAALKTEIQLQAAHCNTSRPVLQLHFGGGTPTYLTDDQLDELMGEIRQHFQLVEDGEYAIEIHPQTVNPERIKRLREMGFNRLSLGVQDFHPTVQRAVNRFNSLDEVSALVQAARDNQFAAISLDLIYGLPHQTCETVRETLQQVISLRPDRISLFNYAHMPELFKVQRQIDSQALPEPQDKLAMLHNAIEQLMTAGYVYIGMDHFALPDDELAKLQRNGKLHRNFQGYATHGNCELLAFGVSAINAMGNVFAQNYKDIDSYQKALNEGHLPINKGIALTQDDLIRQSVIRELICHFTLEFDKVDDEWGIDSRQYFSSELDALNQLATDGLLSMNKAGITVSDTGRLLIRRVCMVFDRYLQQSNTQPRFSRII